MEILLANNCSFPKLVSVRGQAAVPASKPPDVGSQHSRGGDAGGTSPGWRTTFSLGVFTVSTSVVQQCCPALLAEPGSPRRTWPAEELVPSPHL